MLKKTKSLVLGQTLAKKTTITEIRLPHLSGIDSAIAIYFVTKAKASYGLCGLEATTKILID
jgi:hypothetical protein